MFRPPHPVSPAPDHGSTSCQPRCQPRRSQRGARRGAVGHHRAGHYADCASTRPWGRGRTISRSAPAGDGGDDRTKHGVGSDEPKPRRHLVPVALAPPDLRRGRRPSGWRRGRGPPPTSGRRKPLPPGGEPGQGRLRATDVGRGGRGLVRGREVGRRTRSIHAFPGRGHARQGGSFERRRGHARRARCRLAARRTARRRAPRTRSPSRR